MLWFNKVGPYNNPQETYQYFDLPFCRPDGEPTCTFAHTTTPLASARPWLTMSLPRWHAGFHRVKKSEGLGEILEGNELVDSNLDIRFKADVPLTTICTLAVDKSVEKEFIDSGAPARPPASACGG